MNEYKPRQYWSDRFKRQGKKYVGATNMDSKKQMEAFWSHVETVWPTKVNHLLDFGCGVGRLATYASAKVDRYTGVDICKEAIGITPLIDNAEYLYLHDNTLPFEDDSFDLIIAITVLQHIVNDKQMSQWCKELRRVLQSNGHVIIIDGNQKTPAQSAHMKWRTPDIIAPMLGVDIDKTFFINAESEKSHWLFLGNNHD